MDKRFVILLHTAPTGEHWDVMLETETALTTWSVPPQVLPPIPFQVPAAALPPHRKSYLDYEGSISDNRGSVRRIDTGLYNETESAEFQLCGQVFCGVLTIHQGIMSFHPQP